jgi:hypothetical protein
LVSATPIGDNAEGGFELEIGGPDGMKLQTTLLINCAGMSAPAVAGKISGLSKEQIDILVKAKNISKSDLEKYNKEYVEKA